VANQHDAPTGVEIGFGRASASLIRVRRAGARRSARVAADRAACCRLRASPRRSPRPSAGPPGVARRSTGVEAGHCGQRATTAGGVEHLRHRVLLRTRCERLDGDRSRQPSPGSVTKAAVLPTAALLMSRRSCLSNRTADPSLRLFLLHENIARSRSRGATMGGLIISDGRVGPAIGVTWLPRVSHHAAYDFLRALTTVRSVGEGTLERDSGATFQI
jgi:hypothetical protein